MFETGRRWAKLRVPLLNATVLVYGHCRNISPSGELAISIDEITLNPDVAQPNQATGATAPGTPSGSAPVTPQKRRRFNPVAPASPGVESPYVCPFCANCVFWLAHALRIQSCCRALYSLRYACYSAFVL